MWSRTRSLLYVNEYENNWIITICWSQLGIVLYIQIRFQIFNLLESLDPIEVTREAICRMVTSFDICIVHFFICLAFQERWNHGNWITNWLNELFHELILYHYISFFLNCKVLCVGRIFMTFFIYDEDSLSTKVF